MSSKVEICNMALSRIGGSRITSLADATVEAKQLNAIYNQCAKFVMAKAPWPSTKRRATLAQVSTAPEFGYSYQYQLPTNPQFLRVWRMNEFRLGDIDFQIEGNKLLCDEASCAIVYGQFLTDTESYDIYLEEAIVARLAYEMVYTKSGDIRFTLSLKQDLRAEIDDLAALATSQDSSIDIPSDDYVDARRGN